MVMSQIQGTNIAALITPFDTADTYPTHDAQYGRGGYRAVATVTDRDAIPTARRSEGMRVRVTADPVGGNNTDWDWVGGVWIAAPSTMSAASSESARVASVAAKVAAETARDAAMLAGRMYPTTAAGIAATTNGNYFSTPSASPSEQFAQLWMNNAGVASFVNTYPSLAAINAKFDEVLSDDLYAIRAPDGGQLLLIQKDGTLSLIHI